MLQIFLWALFYHCLSNFCVILLFSCNLYSFFIISLVASCLAHMLFRSLLFTFKTFEDFLDTFLLWISSLIPFCSENILCRMLIHLYFCVFFMFQNIVYLANYSLCFFKKNKFIYLFMAVLGLRFCARAFSNCSKWGHSSSRCAGLSLSRPLLLRSTGSRRAGSVAVAHGPSCSAACGIFPDQGSNPCPLHRQADSQPLRHQGSPTPCVLEENVTLIVLSKYPISLLTFCLHVPSISEC